MPIHVNNKEITAINCEGREIVRAHAGLSLVWSKQEDLYGGMDISSIADLVMFRDLINTGTCIWNGVSTNTYKGNIIATGGLGATWYVTADIDMSSVCGAGVGNWVPIGPSSRPFAGTIEGLNFNISNLYCSTPTLSYIGLFGSATGGVFKDLSVTNAYVYGANYVGILCGRNEGTTNSAYNAVLINNIKTQGTVLVQYIGSSYAGGVIGQTVGLVAKRATILNCETLSGSTVSRAQAQSQDIGGITGYSVYTDYNGCINRANVTGYDYLAGIVSYGGYCSILNCSNYGNLNGRQYLAGICARMFYTSIEVDNLWNYGNITGTNSNNAGIIYQYSTPNSTLTINNCHNRGSVRTGIISALPYLSSIQITNCTSICDYNGAGSFYGICASSLATAFINCEVGGNVTLTSGFGYGIGQTSSGQFINCTSSINFTLPTGAYGIGTNGILFQNCHNYGTIYINTSVNSTNVCGIGQGTANAVFTNCTNNANITNQGQGITVGIGLPLGYGNKTYIEDCENHGVVYGFYTAYGIGGNYVTRCKNYGNVSIGTASVPFGAAGITGRPYTYSSGSDAFSVTYCENHGNVDGKRYAAGIMFYGTTSPIINNCKNFGTVTANSTGGQAAGIWCAYNSTSGIIVSYCLNAGSVSAAQYAGGIVAATSLGTVGTSVVKSTNTGAIASAYCATGIISVSGSTITSTNCVSTGSINGVIACGISFFGTVQYCSNRGTVNGSANASGIGYGGVLHLSNLNTAAVITADTTVPQYLGGVGAIKPTTATANFYDTTVAGAIGAYRTVDIGGEGEGRPTSNLLGTSLLGAGSGWTTDNWVFTAGEYPTPRMD